MFIKKLAIIISIISLTAQADEVVISGLYSKHIKNDNDSYNYNEGFFNNYGIGYNKYLIQERKAGVGGIVYKDSYYKTAYSVYAYKEFAYENNGYDIGATLKVGYLNGSGYNGVVAIPSLYIRKDGYKLESIIVPKTKNNTGVITFLVGKEF